MEAVLKFTKLLTTQLQYDITFTGAFRPLIQHTLITSLHSNSLSVIDTSRVAKSPIFPRREKPVSEISDNRKETLRQAQLKAHCSFCGNHPGIVSSSPVVKSCHDMIMSQLGIRTIRSQHMSSGEISYALIQYFEAYSDFDMHCTE